MKMTILPLQLFISPDRNDPKPLVLYHGKGCPDGFASALGCARAVTGEMLWA